MFSLEILKFFRIPTNSQSFLLPLPSLGYRISGKEVEVHGSQHHQLCRHHGVPTLPKPCGPLSCMAATPGLKSQHQSSSAAPFLTPPTISYTCQRSRILPALLGCHSKSRQAWPHGVSQSSASSHTGAVTRGNCFPVTSWVEVTPIPLAGSMATAI